LWCHYVGDSYVKSAKFLPLFDEWKTSFEVLRKI
jgi:hypothetical protein